MSDLRQALLAYLAEAPELARTELGSPPRLVLEPSPQPAYPYLQVGRFVLAAVDDPSRGCITLTCVSLHGGKAEAQALVERVRDALFGAQLVLDGGRRAAFRVSFTDVIRAADWRQTYGLLRVLATVSASELKIAA